VNFDGVAQYREIVLRRVQFYVRTHLSPEICTVDAHLDHLSRSMVVRLKAAIYGETVPEVDVKFPVTWWDAVKDRWFPEWSRRWFPIEYRRVTVDKHTLFPSIEVPGYEARISVTNRDFRWWDKGEDDE
jgi:hypothetical protein